MAAASSARLDAWLKAMEKAVKHHGGTLSKYNDTMSHVYICAAARVLKGKRLEDDGSDGDDDAYSAEFLAAEKAVYATLHFRVRELEAECQRAEASVGLPPWEPGEEKLSELFLEGQEKLTARIAADQKAVEEFRTGRVRPASARGDPKAGQRVDWSAILGDGGDPQLQLYELRDHLFDLWGTWAILSARSAAYRSGADPVATRIAFVQAALDKRLGIEKSLGSLDNDAAVARKPSAARRGATAKRPAAAALSRAAAVKRPAAKRPKAAGLVKRPSRK
eukprot:CAMPEP_0204516876 /NCGR_PEP_ID=MMETSP0661-20131031/3370_1 /ASSEMBLY_ACC=CAM_ASM_000606 /TAXON_ID=109239 /ORGANISM="Alexandrium margalefi, Strain AMGDE01CS-322" /LENGTH=277 /DNA_ID=CAMNT_0051522253 /DNA_START=93 /DNA_END=926 /DNA_ORIENTATION=-